MEDARTVTRMDRLTSERRFHDCQARQRSAFFAEHPDRLPFDDADYLDHESWIRPAFAALGDVRQRDVLDLGCGHGMAAVVLARRGARVTALDLSAGYLAEAEARAAANEVALALVLANGAELPFADSSFDRVWGHAILHHLERVKAAREIRRVLRPTGVAVLCEPWGGNPLLNWARSSLRRHTPDERPLERRDVQLLRRTFAHVEVQGYQFMSMARRALGAGWVVDGLEYCDHQLLDRLPGLQQFCRYVVLTLRR